MNGTSILCLGYRGQRFRVHSIELASDTRIKPKYSNDLEWHDAFDNDYIVVYNTKNPSKSLLINKKYTRDVTGRCSLSSNENITIENDDEFLDQIKYYIPSELNNEPLKTIKSTPIRKSNFNYAMLIVIIMFVLFLIYKLKLHKKLNNRTA